ncbi:hypothetical protein K2173_028135 [Erythroxylum novogranatense]|uniref:Calmodulin-binding domain-containing protein n=1 Tax=Erythroxylum novogranatense TaxID=1862640 RepID=A0AAV8U3N6_9ROSI|nr:hypothetical protein K2173_028135 [Erythroxylum novogranatense]
MDSSSLLVIPKTDSILMSQNNDFPPPVPEAESFSLTVKHVNPKARHIRRHSTGCMVLPYAREKVVSRYLSPSTGSCHDNCKNGMKKNDTSTRTPVQKRTSRPKDEVQDAGKTLIVAQPNKLAVCSTSTLCLKSHKSDILLVSNNTVSLSTKKRDILSKQRSLPPYAFDMCSGHVDSSKLNVKSKASPVLVQECLSKGDGEVQEDKKMRKALLKSHTISSSIEKYEVRGRQEMRTSKRSKNLSDRSFMQPIISLSSKCSIKRHWRASTENLQNPRGLSHLDNHEKLGRVDHDRVKIENLPEKSTDVTGSTVVEKTMKSAQNSCYSTCSPPSMSPSPEDKRSKGRQSVNQTGQLAQPSMKLLSHTEGTTHTARMLQSVDNESLKRDKVQTLVPQLSIYSLESSKPSSAFCSSKTHEIGTGNRSGYAQMEPKTRPRNGDSNSIKENDTLPRKLSFRAGKVVELQLGIKSPRKLQFRQSVPLQSQISEINSRKDTLKQTELEKSEANVEETMCEKVVLKHQDSYVKRVVQSLLNNVIEETASKLAQTRSSKVKALVGAFETVISLRTTNSN